MVLYRALSGCGSILQGVRALNTKGKLYYRGKGTYVDAGIQKIPGQRVGWADVTMVLGLPL